MYKPIDHKTQDPLPVGYVRSESDLVAFFLDLLFRMCCEQGQVVANLPDLLRVPKDLLQGLLADMEAFAELLFEVGTNWQECYVQTMKVLRDNEEQAAAQAQRAQTLRERIVYLGSETPPVHYVNLGWFDDDPNQIAAYPRDEGTLALAAGRQGAGKTVLSTLFAEGCFTPGEPLSGNKHLPTSYAFVHLEENERLPQLLAGLSPNPKPEDLALLKSRLGVSGQGFSRIRIAVPRGPVWDWLVPKLDPYQDLGLEIVPLQVRLSQLGQPGIAAALSADGDSHYTKRLLDSVQEQGHNLSLDGLRHFVDTCPDLQSYQRNLARASLVLLEQISGPPDGSGIWQIFEPGVASILYLGGPFMSKTRVAPIVVALLNALMMPSPEHGPFQRVITVDEVNLLDDDEIAWKAFTKFARLVRHLGSHLLLLGQDLNHVPDELFGLAEFVAVFHLRNPKTFEYIRDRVGALRNCRYSEVESLKEAWAILAATRATSPRWPGFRKVRMRPPCSMHGGFTRTQA